MAWNRIIRGGNVVFHDGVRVADIAIEDGSIAAIGDELSAAGGSAEETDARGLTVFPGVIDAHLHFNDPGRADWEGAATGSAAVAAGGGTCFVDMPLNSSPPTLDAASFDAKVASVSRTSRTDFALYGGLTPESLPTMHELAERGVAGFKAFMCPSGIDDFTWADDLTLLRGMERAASLDLPVLLHAESASITGALEASREGTDVRAFLDSRPAIAELEAITRAMLFARETGCRVHIVHVSTPRGVEIVREAAASGVDATCETCPHYLLLTDRDMEEIGPRAKCAPPLREDATRLELIEAVREGRVDTVGSDHSPSPPSMKEGMPFTEAWGGIAGAQTLLRSLLTLDLPLDLIARLTARNPAQRFGLPRKGSIEAGNDADLAIVDLATSAELTRDELCDRHRQSPFVGRRFTGRIVSVYLRGEPINATTRGRLVTPRS